jgi:hypothetical protein
LYILVDLGRVAHGPLISSAFLRHFYAPPMHHSLIDGHPDDWMMTKMTMKLRAQQALLVLLVLSTAEYRYVHADLSGAAPSSGGLNRLERDLNRRSSSAPRVPRLAPSASQSPSTASKRTS